MVLVSRTALWTLYFLVFVDIFQLSFVWPLVPKIVQDFDRGPTEIGLVSSVAAIGEGLASPIIGAIADRFGRKPVFLIGMLGCAIANVLTGAAQSYEWLLLARLVVGIMGGTPPVAAAYITDVTTEEERPSYMTHYQAAYFLGLMAGPFVGGLINDLADWRVACYASAGLCAANIVTLVFLPESHKEQGAAEVQPLGGELASCCKAKGLPRAMWLIAAAVFLTNWCFSSIEVLGTVYLEDNYFEGDTDGATFFWSITISIAAVVGMIVSLFLYQRMVRCLTLRGCILLGGALGTGSLVLLAFPTHQFVFLGAVQLYALGENLTGTSGFTLLSLCVKPSQVGTAMGVMNMFWNAASVVGPITNSLLYEHADARIPWIIMACLRGAGVVALFFARPRRGAEPVQNEDGKAVADDAPHERLVHRSLARVPGRMMRAPGSFAMPLTKHAPGLAHAAAVAAKASGGDGGPCMVRAAQVGAALYEL